MSVATKIYDSFASLLAGLGAANPQQRAHGYTVDCSPEALCAAYRASTWFGKIVDIPVRDATREWRSWQAEADQIERIEAVERQLKLRQAVVQARTWARLYGGGAIILGGPRGSPMSELRPESVGLGGLKYLNVVSKHELMPSDVIRDPMDPYFGQPRYFRFGSVDIHPSRVIAFRGRQTGGERIVGDWWGDSIWVQMQDAVENSDLAAAAIGALMIQAKRDIIKIGDFIGAVATEEGARLLQSRFHAAATLTSITGSLVLDKDDEMEQKQIVWTGLPDVVTLLLTIMAGAADIPVVRLLGTSAKGLNATGEGDLKNYYDRVSSDQETELSDVLRPLDEMLIRTALGSRPPEIWYLWNPLYQPTQKEEAEIGKMRAETDQIYSQLGIVPDIALARAVHNRMIESGQYPGLEAALAEVTPEELEESIEGASAGQTSTADAAPRPLYVSRRVLNVEDIQAWARSQGFESINADLHVTVIYSRTAVDWLQAGSAREGGEDGELVVPAGGPRVMDEFNGHLVLCFASSALSYRHEEIKRRTGASHDYEYSPHVTLLSDAEAGPPIYDVTPYTGRIVLGPEIFEEAKP